MAKTYPAYPQPILTQSSTGLNYYLEITNAGTLAAKATTTDAATSLRNVTLVADDDTQAYRLGLDASNPPLVTVTAMDSAAFGNFKELPVWSPNGREWKVTVDNAGNLTVTGTGLDWTKMGRPIVEDVNGVPWRFQVQDGGIYEVTSDHTENVLRQPLILRAQDDSKAWKVTVGIDGVLSVTDDNVSLSDTELYEAEIISPGGMRWHLQVAASGVLSVTSVDDLINARFSWPLLLARRDRTLYCVDNRFRYPKLQGAYSR